jgi:MFS family permease
MLCERWGYVPLVRIGLILTILSGAILFAARDHPGLLLGGRIVEGFGAGTFVPAALSALNSRPGHARLSGYFMSLMNAGLVTGLIVSGILADASGMPLSGVLAFTLILIIPVGAGLTLSVLSPSPPDLSRGFFGIYRSLRKDLSQLRWLWLSAFVLIGATGVVSALYPEFSGHSPSLSGLEIAAMSVTTAMTVLIISRLSLLPLPALRIGALCMGGSVLLTFISPLGILLIGAAAGVVIMAQLSYIASAGREQGILIGLFNTASYAGMTFLPFAAGLTAELIREPLPFLSAFLLISCLSLVVAATIGRCRCRPLDEIPL